MEPSRGLGFRGLLTNLRDMVHRIVLLGAHVPVERRLRRRPCKRPNHESPAPEASIADFVVSPPAQSSPCARSMDPGNYSSHRFLGSVVLGLESENPAQF